MLFLGLFHIGVDSLYVFVLIELVEELLDFHHLFVGEADGLVGETLQVGLHDVDLALFEGVVHGAVVGPGGVDRSRGGAFLFVGFGDDFVQTRRRSAP